MRLRCVWWVGKGEEGEDEAGVGIGILNDISGHAGGRIVGMVEVLGNGGMRRYMTLKMDIPELT